MSTPSELTGSPAPAEVLPSRRTHRYARRLRTVNSGAIASACALAVLAFGGVEPGTAARFTGAAFESPIRTNQAANNWRSKVVKAPAGSTVRLTYRVRDSGARSVTIQVKRPNRWRKHKTVRLAGRKRVVVGIPVGRTTARWRLRELSASGSTVHTSAIVKVTPIRSGTWLSGGAGKSIADGSFGAWRGTEVPIAGTWNDSYEAQSEFWTLQPGFELGSWDRDVDMAMGSIYEDRGETWAAAASGEYDARWTASLQKMKSLWSGRSGTLYIRFGHEFNGDWFPWQVRAEQVQDFKKAWKRFRALQKTIMPEAKLVFCPNDGTAAANNFDWRTAFPGARYVDVMSVSSFNQFPFAQTKEQFYAKIMLTDRFGAPVGIERHREFAQSQGLPFAVSEWSSNGKHGESPVFVRQFHKWVVKNAGSGAGKVKYEILFNVRDSSDGVFEMYPSTMMPRTAETYRRLF